MIVSFGTDQKATRFFKLSLRFLVSRRIAKTSGVPPVSRSKTQTEELNPQLTNDLHRNSMRGIAIPKWTYDQGSEK